jgi:hypothetical protein
MERTKCTLDLWQALAEGQGNVRDGTTTLYAAVLLMLQLVTVTECLLTAKLTASCLACRLQQLPAVCHPSYLTTLQNAPAACTSGLCCTIWHTPHLASPWHQLAQAQAGTDRLPYQTNAHTIFHLPNWQRTSYRALCNAKLADGCSISGVVTSVAAASKHASKSCFESG